MLATPKRHLHRNGFKPIQIDSFSPAEYRRRSKKKKKLAKLARLIKIKKMRMARKK